MGVRYPNCAGAKGPDGTSQQAAKEIFSRLPNLRKIAILALHRLGNATSLEAVAAAGLPCDALRPRFSELRALGLAEATGERRLNPSGKSAAVLRLTTKGMEVASSLMASGKLQIEGGG